MKENRKLFPSDAGCLIDSNWGHYAIPQLILLAVSLGWEDLGAEEAAREYHKGIETDFECLYDAADDAEQWMNDNCVPEGYSVGWFDGEFFLWGNEQWEEEDLG